VAALKRETGHFCRKNNHLKEFLLFELSETFRNIFLFIETIFCCKLISVALKIETHFYCWPHKHLSNIDCLTACTACLVCFHVLLMATARKKEKKAKMWC
jgi:hypothetical protein